MKFPIKRTIGLLISLLLIVFIFNQVDLNKTFKVFDDFEPLYLILIIPAYYIGFVFRNYRWKILLSQGLRSKIRNLTGFIFIGYMLNCFLPARAGDFYRAHLLGDQEKIKKVQVFASIVLERIFDGVVVFCFLLLSIVISFNQVWIIKTATAVGCIFVGAFVVLFLMAKYSSPDSFCKTIEKKIQILPSIMQKPFNVVLLQINKHANAFIEGLRVFHNPVEILQTILLTAAIWFFEGIVVFLVVKSFGISLNMFSSLFVLSILVFSGLIPAASNLLGPYQFAYIKALGVFGVFKEKALAVSLTNQTLIMVLITILGIFFFLKHHLKIRAIKQEINSNESISVE